MLPELAALAEKLPQAHQAHFNSSIDALEGATANLESKYLNQVREGFKDLSQAMIALVRDTFSEQHVKRAAQEKYHAL